MTNRPITTLRLASALLIAMTLLAPSAGPAAILLVDPNVPDLVATDGFCALREAVINTNDDAATWPDCPAGTGADRIDLAAGTHELVLPLEITGELILAGMGADQSGLATGGVHVLAGAIATITDLEISYGNAPGVYGGFATISSWGSLRLERVWVRGSRSIPRCGFRCGGNDGFGVVGLGPKTEILDSTLSEHILWDTPSWLGFAIFATNAVVRNTTISGSGQVFIAGSAHHTTISDNQDVYVSHLSDSLLGTAAEACRVDSSGGHNLDADGTCGLVDPTDVSGVDPRLGVLADNGGGAPTHALLAGSPAIDAIPAAGCSEGADQRGVARPQGSACDVGAFERVPPAPGPSCGLGPEIPLLLTPLLLARGMSGGRRRDGHSHNEFRAHPGMPGV